MSHKLISAHLVAKLLANGAKSAAGEDIDPSPLVKLFTPDANASWLLTELDPNRPTIAFGLADMGMGCPELGSFCLSEIAKVRGGFGLPVERDRHYVETRPLSVLAQLARATGHV